MRHAACGMRLVCLTYLLGATPSGAIHGVTDEVHSGRSISPLKVSTSRRRCWPDIGRKRLLPAAGVARGQRSGCEGTHPAERTASAGPEGGCSVVQGRRPSCSPRCAEMLRSGHLWPQRPHAAPQTCSPALPLSPRAPWAFRPPRLPVLRSPGHDQPCPTRGPQGGLFAP